MSIPTDPIALGKYEEAASVEYSYFDTAVSRLGWEKIFKKIAIGKDADPMALAQVERELKGILDHYERVLGERRWFAGEVS